MYNLRMKETSDSRYIIHSLLTELKSAVKKTDIKPTKVLCTTDELALDIEIQPFSFEQNFPGPLFLLINVSTSAAVTPVHPESTLDFA